MLLVASIGPPAQPAHVPRNEPGAAPGLEYSGAKTAAK
jgi:hypothetical protein